MNTKTRVAVVVTFLFVLLPIRLFAFQNDPDGFRGIKWETNISTLKDMIYVKTEAYSSAPSAGEIKGYARKNDELKLGGAKLDSILYCFWQGRFCNVLISFTGSTNFYGIKDACEIKFGKFHFLAKHWYGWGGGEGENSTSIIALDFSEISNQGTLLIQSKSIREEQNRYDYQKAKEGAEKGF